MPDLGRILMWWGVLNAILLVVCLVVCILVRLMAYGMMVRRERREQREVAAMWAAAEEAWQGWNADAARQVFDDLARDAELDEALAEHGEGE